MNEMMMDTRSRRMLELLAQGAGSKLIAKELGYQEGTMRVYLHNLYRKIGVGNKTEAVIWYLRRTGMAGMPAAEEAPQDSASPDDLFGEMALAEGLYAALGVMSRFIGPYGRLWEIGVRLSGEEPDPRKRPQRERARALWNALLGGDFAQGKQVYDVAEGGDVLMESAPDAVLLVSLLAAGGYSAAAEQVAARLTDRRRARLAIPAREVTLVKVLAEAFDPKSTHGLAKLGRLASDRAAPPATRQLAIVLSFHAHRARKDAERARQAAAAIWSEAEEARKDLQAMGDRALGGRPQAATARVGGREKAAAR
jgi:DNA-binding CsgD family transcriptional regulator